VIHYACRKCGAELTSPSSMAGRQDRCPLCGEVQIIPRRKSRLLPALGLCLAIALMVSMIVVAVWPDGGTVGRRQAGDAANEQAARQTSKRPRSGGKAQSSRPVVDPWGPEPTAPVNAGEQGRGEPAVGEPAVGKPAAAEPSGQPAETRPAPDGPGSSKKVVEDRSVLWKLHFKCGKCGHEFELTRQEYTDWAMRTRPDPQHMGTADCPKCGGNFTCARMTRCPSCEKYFPPGSVRRVEESGMIVWRCPHCGAELNKAPSK